MEELAGHSVLGTLIVLLCVSGTQATGGGQDHYRDYTG